VFCIIKPTVCDVGTSSLKTTATSPSRLDMETTVIYATTNQTARSHNFAVYVIITETPQNLYRIE